MNNDLNGFTIIKNLSTYTPSALYTRLLVRDEHGKYLIYTGGLYGNQPTFTEVEESVVDSIMTARML